MSSIDKSTVIERGDHWWSISTGGLRDDGYKKQCFFLG